MNLAKLPLWIAIAALLITPTAFATDFDLSWHTIGGGGGTSSGGGFTVSGTIGQHDADAVGMTGGAFELNGGFWSAGVPSCNCLGDMNSDGVKNGADVQAFVDCIIVGGSCGCADVDAMNGVTFDDTAAFVSELLSGATCP